MQAKDFFIQDLHANITGLVGWWVTGLQPPLKLYNRNLAFFILFLYSKTFTPQLYYFQPA